MPNLKKLLDQNVLDNELVQTCKGQLGVVSRAIKSYRSACYSGAALEALQSVLAGVEGDDEVVIHRVVAAPVDAARLMQNWGMGDLGCLQFELWTKEFLQPTMYAMTDATSLDAEARQGEGQAQDDGNDEGSKETFSVWELN